MNARMRIAIPGSPNDGKEVEVLAESGGYDALEDRYREDFASIALVGTDKQGGIDKRYLVDLK